MTFHRNVWLLLLTLLLCLAAPVHTAALPASDWWLVLHDQCDDTLHWINPSGEFASIPRPVVPDEAPLAACTQRPMHISQDGRYLVQTTMLTNGNGAVGFYDLQTGEWLRVFEGPFEEALLGARYSSDAGDQIAIGFAARLSSSAGWRVILFDMTTGDERYELRSDGPDIAGFAGGEFLATTPVLPQVLLVTQDPATGGDMVVIRFDDPTPGAAPLGALAWYPLGVPGTGASLVASAFTAADIDLLPNGHAIETVLDSAYPPGPPAEGGLGPVTSNVVSLLRPATPGQFGVAEAFYTDGASTVFDPHWGADERLAVFHRYDGTNDRVHWIRLGSAVLTPIDMPVAQVIGVPGGFLFNTADGIYFLNEALGAPMGPLYTNTALSGSMRFVWATAYGNPPLALDTPLVGTSGASSPPSTIVTATPDTGVCRIRSAGGNVNIRMGPGTGFGVLGNLTASNELPVLGYNGDWYVVSYGGVQGWVAGWVSVLLGNCGSLPVVAAPAGPVSPPTSAPPTPVPGAPAQPDLFVSEFALDPATPVQGQAVNVRVGVYNRGNAPATSGFHIAWYPGENYPSPACEWDLDSLVATGGRILNCTYAGYPSPYGSINTLVVVDTANAVGESDEANNRYTRGISVSAPGGGGSAGQPDLFVSEFALDPATPVQGQTVNVRVGVYNQGSAAAGSFHVVWYPGENYPSPACEWDIDSMSAGGGRILNCSYAGYPSPYGSINTRVVVDTANSVSESNEGNNAYTQGISVSAPASAGQPDLFVSEFALDPGTPVQGQTVNVRVGVYNQGSTAAGGFHVAWYPGENYPSPACEWDLDSMSAGGGRILNCSYAGYPSPYGSINTRVVVDTANSVSESNEGNNSYLQNISVASP